MENFDSLDPSDFKYFVNKLCIFKHEKTSTVIFGVISFLEILVLCYMLFRAYKKHVRMTTPMEDCVTYCVLSVIQLYFVELL